MGKGQINRPTKSPRTAPCATARHWHRAPIAARRHRLHRRHICARRVAHRQIIGVEAIDDRCEHRIRGAELAEEKLPCPAETRAGVDESLIDALYIGERLVAHFDRTARAADIHRAFAAQGGEAGMHLGRERTRVGAPLRAARPNRKDRIGLGQIFDDCEQDPIRLSSRRATMGISPSAHAEASRRGSPAGSSE